MSLRKYASNNQILSTVLICLALQKQLNGWSVWRGHDCWLDKTCREIQFTRFASKLSKPFPQNIERKKKTEKETQARKKLLYGQQKEGVSY